MRRAIDLIHFVIREGMSPDQVDHVKYNNEDDHDNGKNVDDRSQPWWKNVLHERRILVHSEF